MPWKLRRLDRPGDAYGDDQLIGELLLIDLSANACRLHEADGAVDGLSLIHICSSSRGRCDSRVWMTKTSLLGKKV